MAGIVEGVTPDTWLVNELVETLSLEQGFIHKYSSPDSSARAEFYNAQTRSPDEDSIVCIRV